MSEGRPHPLDQGAPPAWAAAWGQDRFGVFVVLEVDGVEQKMRWIEPGSFMMGSPSDDEERFDREEPQHLVKLDQGFWLADTPCTQALWTAVTGENPSRFSSPEHPVEQVSWNDCREFFQLLENRIPGFGGRFPTEAEWEYACRAGVEASRYGELDEIAWYSKNSENSTHPVGLKKPNVWGLYDMLGNLFEWCGDWYGSYSEEAVVNPTGPEKGTNRVFRGGSWILTARLARAAFRDLAPPSSRWRSRGFRLARGQSLPGKGAEPQARSAPPTAASGEGRTGAAVGRG